MNHFAVPLKLTQHCKSAILQFFFKSLKEACVSMRKEKLSKTV